MCVYNTHTQQQHIQHRVYSISYMCNVHLSNCEYVWKRARERVWKRKHTARQKRSVEENKRVRERAKNSSNEVREFKSKNQIVKTILKAYCIRMKPHFEFCVLNFLQKQQQQEKVTITHPHFAKHIPAWYLI